MPILDNSKETLWLARSLYRSLDIEERLNLAKEALDVLGPEDRRKFLQKMEDEGSESDPYKITKKIALKRFREALLRVSPAYYRSLLPANLESFGERVFAYGEKLRVRSFI